MKIRNDVSTDVTEESSELGKRPAEELFDAIGPVSRLWEAPGHDCAYLHSASYQNIDKLVSKFGRLLTVTDSDFEAERKIIWLSVKNTCGKETPALSLLLRTGSRSETREISRVKVSTRKQHLMRLRDKSHLDFSTFS
jgi:hypothetical protein